MNFCRPISSGGRDHHSASVVSEAGLQFSARSFLLTLSGAPHIRGRSAVVLPKNPIEIGQIAKAAFVRDGADRTPGVEWIAQ
jgi:hypothetical protein